MRKKIFITLIISAFSISYASAQIHIDNQGNISNRSTKKAVKQQKESKQLKSSKSYKFDRSKLLFGGSLGMQFGDNTVVDISPQLGYRFNKHLTAGAGLGYTYRKEKYTDIEGRNDLKGHYASLNIYGRVYPISFIVLSVQPEANYVWLSNDRGYKESKFVPSVLVGGGLRILNLHAMIQYDVVQDDYSPYSDKIFYTVGYTFNF